ncbi:MAG TPA: single-stranded DNA-binding protein [Candidatus Binatia bacterium]
MASLNKVMVLGNLGQDPELRNTTSGKAVTTLRVATTDSWNDANGQRQERTEWHTIVVWGRQAENCKQYLAKGRQVFVEGRLQTRKWQDKEGHDRYSTEIVADRVQFVGGAGGAAGAGAGAGTGAGRSRGDEDYSGPSSGPPADDDIPF